ncbi:ParA family protein [Polyangium sp. y55x31]|uniref:ParA family protein n=1 Tax=Polyangium sp. y55x31 TaxID=3042688 RepID=UPI0024822924|nr:ParA family protein [Polyangium sp. y55x31]MDI1476102.1 ParA family protein [Polyangium sp. y55x31]
MAGIRESCSVCGSEFDVQFRYQMEERDGGFSFYCSQKCLEKSQLGGEGQGDKLATCDACAKRFQPELASQVMYLNGRRTYACSMPCRTQLQREASGVRLGEIAAEVTPQAVAPSPPPQSVPRTVAPRAAGPASSATPTKRASSSTSPAVAVPVVPQVANKRTTPAAQASQAAPAAPEAPKEQAADASVPRYLAVFNHKGGTGKTTTAVSIAAGLASRGKKVLLVDTDAQGNVSVSLGANVERSLYHVLVMGLRVADATRVVRPNLDLLGSNETLAAAELYLAGRQNRDRVLCERLSAAAAGYDYVVLDCSPSLSLMNQNALVFADSVLVPVACDYLSLVGVRQVIKTVKNVNSLLHHPVQIWGVLPTFFDARAKICREAVTTLKQHFGDRCLPPVRAAIKVKEAPAQGQTIFEYAAGTPAADDYGVVVDRIIQSREGAAKGAKDTKDAKPASRAAATA